jgi:hypothetical protein
MRIVKLLQPHNHAGVDYQIGDEIELTDAQAEWLINSYIEQRIQIRELAKHTPETVEWYDDKVKEEAATFVKEKAKRK